MREEKTKINHRYRERAIQSLKLAKQLLEDSDMEHSVRHACLELRLGLEAVTMAHATAYEEFLQNEWLTKWQPRQVLSEMLKIDQHAQHSVTLSVELGEGKDKTWNEIGTTRPVSKKELNKIHNSLGFFLHAPAINKMQQEGWFDMEKAKRRAVEACKVLEEALRASLFDLKLNFTHFEFDCERCANSIHILNMFDGDKRDVECGNPNCRAPYLATVKGEKLLSKANKIPISCATDSCENIESVWADEVRAASKWTGDNQPYLQWTCVDGHTNMITLRNIKASNVVKGSDY